MRVLIPMGGAAGLGAVPLDETFIIVGNPRYLRPESVDNIILAGAPGTQIRKSLVIDLLDDPDVEVQVLLPDSAELGIRFRSKIPSFSDLDLLDESRGWATLIED